MKLDHASASRDGFTEAERDATASLTREDRAQLLRYMLMMRLSEERAITLYRQGKVPGSFYDGCGQEAISVGASFPLAPEDRLCILHRDLGACLVPRSLAQVRLGAGIRQDGEDLLANHKGWITFDPCPRIAEEERQ